MSSAVIGPWSTSATSTATTPAIVAPMRGTNPPRKTSTPIARTNGTSSTAAPIITPTASTAATITVARTNCTSDSQATFPELSTRSRATRGASRTTHDQIRSPSARKKYVANRVMKKPGHDVAHRRPDLGDPAEDLAVLRALGDHVLRAPDPVVDLGVAGLDRPVAQPLADLLETPGPSDRQDPRRRSPPAGRRTSAARRSPRGRRGRPAGRRGPSGSRPGSAGAPAARTGR